MKIKKWCFEEIDGRTSTSSGHCPNSKITNKAQSDSRIRISNLTSLLNFREQAEEAVKESIEEWYHFVVDKLPIETTRFGFFLRLVNFIALKELMVKQIIE